MEKEKLSKRMLVWFKKHGVALSAKRKKKGPARTGLFFGGDSASVRVLARFLDDGAPLVDFRLEELVQRFRGSAVERVGFGAEVGEALLYRRVLKRLLQGRDQLVDRGLGRAFRRVQPVPDADLEALQPQLVKRRDVVKRGHALPRGHRIRF